MTNNHFADCPAYPNTQDFIDTGLTKREYFAAAALNGILSHPYRGIDPKYVAISAVQYADALINELNQKDDKI